MLEKSDKEMIGFVILKYLQNNNSYKIRRVALLKQRNGYGRELLIKIFNYCFKKANLTEIWLEVYNDNLVAIKLYEKLGMQRMNIENNNYEIETDSSNIVVYSINNN